MHASTELRIPASLWKQLIEQLHARTGRGRHESGAFLLGHITDQGREVTQVLYFDDLHPDVHARGVVELPAAAFRSLWAIVRERGLQVVADVHTHPHGARQSEIDRENPLIATRGHIALIVPNFARPPLEREALGIYIYEGDHRWQTLYGGGHRFIVLENEHD